MKTKILIVALLFLGALQVKGATTTKTNPGPPTIPASIVYVGNEAEIAFSVDGALIYNITNASPNFISIDFGSCDIDQLDAGKYLFHINSNRTTNVTIVVKGVFTKNLAGIANNLSGIIGITNIGTGIVKVSLENFEMPNLGPGTEDFPLKIIENVGSTGPVEAYALNLKGRRYNAGVFDVTGDGLLDEFTIGATNLGSGENTNIPITFISNPLPITWLDISVNGSDVSASAVLTGNDVKGVEAQYFENGKWLKIQEYDPGSHFTHKAIKGGIYRFTAFYKSGKESSTAAVNVKWADVGYRPAVQLSKTELILKGWPEGTYVLSLTNIQGQSITMNLTVHFGEEKRISILLKGPLLVINTVGSLMLQGKALCKDDSSFWNPLKEL
jgi:hypothetical protein